MICKHDFSFQREQINLAKNQILCFHAKMVLELFRIDYLVWLEHKLKLIHHFCSEHSNIRGPPPQSRKATILRPKSVHCDLNLCIATIQRPKSVHCDLNLCMATIQRPKSVHCDLTTAIRIPVFII